MITSIHTMIYSNDPPVTRAFLRDVLGWPYIEHAESEPGWLIFKCGPAETGVHPTHYEWEGKKHEHPLHHSISLMCDDIEDTIAELKAKGAEFKGEVADYGFGLTIMMTLPAAGEIMLYQPQHPTAYNL
ncbi:MAG: VOC family protein [Armatimonadota bacterium]|nr:VOC family protein [Armatimonadota bacterium]